MSEKLHSFKADLEGLTCEHCGLNVSRTTLFRSQKGIILDCPAREGEKDE